MRSLLRKHFTGARKIPALKFSCLQEEQSRILKYRQICYFSVVMIMNRATEMATDRALGSTRIDGSKNGDFAIFLINVLNKESGEINKVIYSHK
jgi:hypothetical protein